MTNTNSDDFRDFTLSSVAIRRPVATMALTAVVIVLGIIFSGRLPVSLLPEVDYPHIRVVVNYPGVIPEVIEEQVTRVLERNLSATENLTELHGRASEGRSYIEMYFEVGTNTDMALQDAARQLERARTQLPPGIEPPRLMKMDPSQNPVYELAFRSTTLSSIALRNWIDQRLVPQLLTVRGTGTIEAVGGREREIDVVADPVRMNSYGLGLDDLALALSERNVDIASGNITSGEYDVLGRTESRYRNASQVASTILRLPGSDRHIRLSDVAAVSDTHREQRLFARVNGEEAVQVSIMKQPDANTVEVIDGLERVLAELSATGYIPAGIEFEVIRDESFFIRSSLRSVSMAAIAGGVLAMIIIFLFLGSIRKSLIIGLTLPVAIIATFLLMAVSGLTLNVMSLGGLALGVGLLIDNGLVILENISRHQEQLGMNARDAARHGTAEVYTAVVAGTMTNMAAVLPFLFVTGMAALIFRELILTIAFAMLASLVAALTLVPSLASLAGTSKKRFLKNENTEPARKPDGPVNQIFDKKDPDDGKPGAGLLNRTMEGLSEYYRNTIPELIKHRYLALILSVIILAGSFLLIRNSGTEFLPPVDDGRIDMRFVLPLGTPPDPTNEAAIIIEELIKEMPFVTTFYTTAGGYFRGGQLSLRGGMIDMVVQLAPGNERRGYSSERWVAEFGSRIRGTGFTFIQQRIRGPRIEGLQTSLVDYDISVGVVGEDLDILEETARRIMDRIREVEGLTGVQIGRDERIPQVIIRLDDERAADLGISVAGTGQAIRTAVDGMVPTRFVTGGFEYNIRLRLPRTITGSVHDLANFPIKTPDGMYVSLGNLAEFEQVMSPAHIERLNQIRIVRVNGTVNPEESTLGQVNERVRAALEGFELPGGYAIAYGGAADSIREINRSMFHAILFALFFVLVVMAVQYEKLSSPLVILSTLPFSLSGVALLVWLTGISLSAPVLLGVIFLIGIVVNNSILFVEFADRIEEREDGSPAEAVTMAGAIRLRPVIMTTLTTIFGMLPLALALGEGSELLQPLAITVIGGLALGMIFTLLLLPGIYIISGDIRRLFRQ